VDKENVIYIGNGILKTFQKRRNPMIFNNMEKSGGSYDK
jgi:hypothetical protein